MSKKSVDELLFEDGEPKAPTIRGTINKWIEDREEADYTEDRGNIPVRHVSGLKNSLFDSWESWIGRKCEGRVVEVAKEYGCYEDVENIFHSYLDNNDDVFDRVKSISYWCKEGHILLNVAVAEDMGGIDYLLEKHGKEEIAKAVTEDRISELKHSTNGDSSAEGEHNNQSSLGESEFPQLHDLGVVDDSGNFVKPKLRGLAVAFSDDIDEIEGPHKYFKPEYAQRAFLEWGHEKFGEEWLNLAAKYVDTKDIYAAVAHVYSSMDDVSHAFHTKYEHNDDLDQGKFSTDEVIREFLKDEVDGFEEEEEDNHETRSTDRWQQFEEISKEKGRESSDSGSDSSDNGVNVSGDTDSDSGDGSGSDDTVDSKWKKYEQRSKEAKTSGEKNGSSGNNNDGSDGSDVSDDCDDNSGASGGTLESFAEEHGSVSEEKRKQQMRERAKQLNRQKKIAERPRVTDTTNPDLKRPQIQRMESLDRNKIYEGNVYEWASKLPENSVDVFVTSPPYYALRDYEVENAVPVAGDFTCDHEWEDDTCTKCGAWMGQLGREPDPALFVDHIVDLMGRLRDVLKPTGSLWLNIGDTYAGEDFNGRVNVREKSRMYIPERVYTAMIEDGWCLRTNTIWAKKVWMPDDDLRGNGKPYAGSGRIANQWEPIPRFTPGPDHYSDVDSNRLMPPSFDGDLGKAAEDSKFRDGEDTRRGKTYNSLGTNPPDVWLINGDGYDGDHRAVFPEQLPARCIKLSCPDRVCTECGIPYEKEVKVHDDTVLSPGGDYAEYTPGCNCNADHEPGVVMDPFLGSGTTAVAAANNGFDWIGVELSPKYADLARERIPTGRQVGLSQY